MSYIEEYEGEHFGNAGIYQNTDKEIEESILDTKRFTSFVGGCGIGESDTVKEARTKIYTYISKRMEERVKDLKEEIESIDQLRKHMRSDMNDPSYMLRFLV